MWDDEIVQRAVDRLSADDPEGAVAVLDAGLRHQPENARFWLVRGVAERQAGRMRAGIEAFWAALAGDPGSAGARAALAEAAVVSSSEPLREFAFDSGERQTAPEVSGIRPDHRARYAAAGRWLRDHLDTPRLRTGLDAFCGNGYGSRIVADVAGTRMIGLDASAEAVVFATRHYGSHRVAFGDAVFPFVLAEAVFDFAVCFESIEHVEDSAGLLRQIAAATDGPVAVSVPLDEGLPFSVNRDIFSSHYRHFTRDALAALLAEVGRPMIVAEWGQTVYRLLDGRLDGMLPPGEMELHAPRPGDQFLMAIATAGA